MADTLSDLFVRNLRPEEKEYTRREKGGFGIRVLPSGRKVFFFLYRVDGKRRFLNLGSYKTKDNPDGITLAKAREEYEAERARVRALKSGRSEGADPVEEARIMRQQRQEQRYEAAKTPTVSDLAAEFLEKWVKKRKVERSVYDDTRTLEKDVLPKWGKRKAKDIRRRDAILLLEEIAERAPGQARNVLKVARKMFSFALQREIVEINPFAMITGSVPELAPGKRERVLSAEEVKLLWERLGAETISGSDETRKCLKLILVTGQRPGEVAGIHRDEIVGRWWTIPAARAKNGQEHRVYLTDTALELIGNAEGYIFPSPKGTSGMTVNALSHSLRNNFDFPVRDEKGKLVLGADGKHKTENRLGVQHFTPHDLRRTVRTFLAEIGVPRDHSEAVLNHKLQGIEGVYNRYKYQAEIQAALESWERKLRSILTGEAGKVIPMNRQLKSE